MIKNRISKFLTGDIFTEGVTIENNSKIKIVNRVTIKNEHLI